MARLLKIHPDVDKKDCPRLTQSQAKIVVNAMKRLAAGIEGFDNVEPMREFAGLFRWKPPVELQCNGCDVRVVFCPTTEYIEVLVVSARDDVYQKVQERV